MELDTKKSGSNRLAPTSAGRLTGNGAVCRSGVFLPHRRSDLRPRGSRRCSWTTEIRKRLTAEPDLKPQLPATRLLDPNLKAAPLNQCIKKARWLLGHRAVHLIIRISIERCSWCRYCSRPFLPLYLYGRLGMYRPLQNRYSHWLNGDPGSCRSGRSDAC